MYKRQKLHHEKAKAVDWEASQLSSLSEHQRASQDSSHKIKPYEFIAPLPKQVELSETMIKTDFLPYKAKNKTAKANTKVENGTETHFKAHRRRCFYMGSRKVWFK